MKTHSSGKDGNMRTAEASNDLVKIMKLELLGLMNVWNVEVLWVVLFGMLHATLYNFAHTRARARLLFYFYLPQIFYFLYFCSVEDFSTLTLYFHVLWLFKF